MAERSPLRDYYDAQKPSVSCVERLKTLETSAEPEPLPPRRRWAKPLTAAALIAFILGVSLWSNSVVNPKPLAEGTPPVDLAAQTPIPSENEPDMPSGNTVSPDPVESTEPDLPPADSVEPPEEGDAGSSSGSSFDPFWWLRMGGSGGAGLPGWGFQGSDPPGSGSGSGASTPAPVPALPGMGGSGMGLPSPRDWFPQYAFVTNSDGTVYAAHYSLGVRHYLFLVSTDGAQKTIDVTDLTTDATNGVYDADVTVGNHTVHVTLDVRQEGSAALTVY